MPTPEGSPSHIQETKKLFLYSFICSDRLANVTKEEYCIVHTKCILDNTLKSACISFPALLEIMVITL